MFFFFLLTNAANLGLTETQFTFMLTNEGRALMSITFGTSWDICRRSVKALFLYPRHKQADSVHDIWQQECSILLYTRRHSTYFHTVKSTVRTVPLRLFHLFHNTSYCEAAPMSSGENILLFTLISFFICPRKWLWHMFATKCGQIRANSCFYKL